MNILSEKKLPAYDDFFEILNLTSDILENEDECYRPKNDDAEAGGLVDFQNEEKLTVVVPDLHARTFFLQNILIFSIITFSFLLVETFFFAN